MGEKLWDINVVNNVVQTETITALNNEDPNQKRKVSGGTGVGISMAPVVYENKVIIGITGVGYGREEIMHAVKLDMKEHS